MKPKTVERVSKTMDTIVKRERRRKEAYIDQNKLSGNSAFGVSFFTPKEHEILHDCRQWLMENDLSGDSNLAKQRNRDIIKLAKDRGLTRQQARNLYYNGEFHPNI